MFGEKMRIASDEELELLATALYYRCKYKDAEPDVGFTLITNQMDTLLNNLSFYVSGEDRDLAIQSARKMLHRSGNMSW